MSTMTILAARIAQAELAHAAGHVDIARDAARSALAVLEPRLVQQDQDRATALATVDARLLLADVSAATIAATPLRQQALGTMQAQTSALADPRPLALHVQSLPALRCRLDAIALLPPLSRTGHRESGLVALDVEPPPALATLERSGQ